MVHILTQFPKVFIEIMQQIVYNETGEWVWITSHKKGSEVQVKS